MKAAANPVPLSGPGTRPVRETGFPKLAQVDHGIRTDAGIPSTIRPNTRSDHLESEANSWREILNTLGQACLQLNNATTPTIFAITGKPADKKTG